MKKKLRRIFLLSAHRLEVWAKQLKGAADKVIPEKRIFLMDCEQNGWQNSRPCFVLSTGRSGTLLLNNLLLLAPEAMPLHEPVPELYRPSREAYERIDREPAVFREIFKACREEYLLKAVRQDKIYIETNNQITFFAPIIREVFPNAVFLHLVRHPGSFVRSGIRRKWYTGEHSHDIGRIVPVLGDLAGKWTQLHPIEKMGWLWNETNQFIENFKKTIPAEDCLFVKAEEMFSQVETARGIFQFLGLSYPGDKAVKSVIQKPVNVQKKGDFPPFKTWPEEDKQRLRDFAPLAEKYGYDL